MMKNLMIFENEEFGKVRTLEESSLMLRYSETVNLSYVTSLMQECALLR